MKKTTLKISGMTCGHCARRVTTALKELEGVESAEVDLAKGSALVAYDEARTDTAKMAGAVAEAGYTVQD